MVKMDELLAEAGDAIGVKRIYGDPYDKNGVTVIPAARIMGGAGGGEGEMPRAAVGGDDEVAEQPGAGSGGGYGLAGGPAGAYVIKGDEVRWVPAVDVNRLMLGFQLVLIVFFLVMRSIAKSRARGDERSVASEG